MTLCNLGKGSDTLSLSLLFLISDLFWQVFHWDPFLKGTEWDFINWTLVQVTGMVHMPSSAHSKCCEAAQDNHNSHSNNSIYLYYIKY